jgi:hypothetical protein
VIAFGNSMLAVAMICVRARRFGTVAIATWLVMHAIPKRRMRGQECSQQNRYSSVHAEIVAEGGETVNFNT